MGNMKDIGLLDCEDRPSIEENFKRVQSGGGGGGVFDVTISMQTTEDGGTVYVSDKTPFECIAAHNEGKYLRVYADWYGGMYGFLADVNDKEDTKEVAFILPMIGSSLSLLSIGIVWSEGYGSSVYVETYKINFDSKPA